MTDKSDFKKSLLEKTLGHKKMDQGGEYSLYSALLASLAVLATSRF